jgi:hypothetical protein
MTGPLRGSNSSTSVKLKPGSLKGGRMGVTLAVALVDGGQPGYQGNIQPPRQWELPKMKVPRNVLWFEACSFEAPQLDFANLPLQSLFAAAASGAI